MEKVSRDTRVRVANAYRQNILNAVFSLHGKGALREVLAHAQTETLKMFPNPDVELSMSCNEPHVSDENECSECHTERILEFTPTDGDATWYCLTHVPYETDGRITGKVGEWDD